MLDLLKCFLNPKLVNDCEAAVDIMMINVSEEGNWIKSTQVAVGFTGETLIQDLRRYDTIIRTFHFLWQFSHKY